MKKRPHSNQIVQSSPASPENGHAGMPITFASQKATELSDPEYGLRNGWWLNGRFSDAGGMGVERLPLSVGERSRTEGVRFLPGKMGQPMQTPGNDHIESQTGEQTVGIFEATVLDSTARFENLVPNFDLPALAVPLDALQRILRVLHRHSGQQEPLHGGNRLRRVDLAYLNRPKCERGQ